MSALAHDPDGSMTIGEVLSLLSPDFPDISISKIRFLEGEGLISPQRAPSGYRRFTGADVDRLRLVLTAQRDRYLPLRVIKEQLASGELQAELDREPETEQVQPEVQVQVDASRGVPQPQGKSTDIDPNALFTRPELAELAALTMGDVKRLEEFGVLEPDPAGRYSGAQVLVSRAFAVLRGYGVEERHMRQVKNGAGRDVGLVANAVAHLGPEQRVDAIAELLESLTDAHYWLIMAGLTQSTPAAGHRARRPVR